MDFAVDKLIKFFKNSVFILVFCCPFFAFGDDWVLAGQKFTFSQKRVENSSNAKIASVLPQLILEQIAENSIRSVSSQEQLDRELYALQTERLSLFLQLSKENKTRDSLVLAKTTPRELKKAIREEEEKISEIEKKIDENLSAVQKTKEKYSRQIALENGEIFDEKKRDDNFFGKLPFAFMKKKDGESKKINETVVLYKNDPSSLFSPSEKAMELGEKSFSFTSEISTAKINALLTGKIALYGEYVSVSVNLYFFPGADSSSEITEVGNANDLVLISQNIARNLMPEIANSVPVKIKIEIEPEQAAKSGIVSVDGVIVPSKEEVIVNAGVHSITVSANGFEKQTVNYAFAGEDFFTVKTTLRPLAMGNLELCLKKMAKGVFYFNALDSSPVDEENRFASSTVNGRPVLGIFETSEGESAFIYISEKLAQDGNTLSVNAKPYDREKHIDRQRRRMYTAYSVLICSLVPTFFTVGNFTAVNNSYAAGRANFDEVEKWQKYSYYSIGVSCTAGAWFAFEMVRYLFAANEVLPARAVQKK